MAIWQSSHERLGPYPPGMAVEKLGRADHERHVDPVGAQLHDRIGAPFPP